MYSTLQLHRLDESHGIEAVMVANSTGYQKTCRLKYNKTKLHCAEKRMCVIVDDRHDTGACKPPGPCQRAKISQGPPPVSSENNLQVQNSFMRQ